MSSKIDKSHTGKCPVTNQLNTIDVTYLCGGSTLEGTAYQKQSFSCANSECKYFLNQTCPVFKEIPFTSIQ